jgi:hypothetical protein
MHVTNFRIFVNDVILVAEFDGTVVFKSTSRAINNLRATISRFDEKVSELVSGKLPQ